MIKTSDTVRPAVATAFRPQQSSTVLRRVLQVGVSVYQLVAAAAFVVALLLARLWIKLPFIGALYDQSLVVTRAVPTGDSEDWDLYNQGIWAGNRIVAVNGSPVFATAQVQTILAGFFPGESIPITVRNADGAERSIEVKLNAFPSQDWTVYAIFPAVMSLLFLAMSLWIFGLRRAEATGRAFGVLSASLSIVFGSLFDAFTTHTLTYLWILGLTMTGGALIDLTLSFPSEARLAVGRPYVRWTGYLVALGLAAYALFAGGTAIDPGRTLIPWRLITGFVSLATIAYIINNLRFSLAAQSPVVKTQARMILIGTLAAVGPLAVFLLIDWQRPLGFTPYILLPIVIFPVTLGYTILRFRFVRADDWLRQGVIYFLLSFFIIGAYALIVTGLSLIFKTAFTATNPLWIGALVFVLAVLLDPIRVRLQGFVDRTFFRGPRVYVETVQSLAHDLTGALGLGAIGRLLRNQIVSALAPTAVHIFVLDPVSDQFAALPDENGRPTTDVRFSSSGPLAQYLARERLPMYLDGTSVPSSLQPDQSRLALLAARLFVAMPGREHPVGWLALGPRLSGQPYTPRDLDFLERLADQASVAVQRVQTVENLERRVQEMNTLTRVSQGVNITLTFDDVLELVYAQTAQILPLSHFYITLHDREQDYFYLAFAVEGNERLTAREDLPLSSDAGLAPEVVRRGLPILTQDYVRECQSRSLRPISEGIVAWMGVPLNAGAESIGALSVGSRDPATSYTQGQLELLRAIADQTAGAIVKARLLRETQQRAAQLSKLNEVTRQLASTLELEPLLHSVVEGAVNILNCEAGIFWATDQATGELSVRAANWAARVDPHKPRTPPNTGVARRAAIARAPVIDNDLAAAPAEGGASDFAARGSLAAPLLVQERLLGVLEVINRLDARGFNDEDRALLAAFSAQAAVAMENVRLYTLTDQELAARVEELSVMQRIDRELNASLEMGRAMRITLEWALRQSNADAGLIGMLEEDRLRLMAQVGYDETLDNAAAQYLPLSLPGFQLAVETGLPQRIDFQAAGTTGSLAGSDHRVVVPIRREANVIGLLALESTRGSQEDLAFLSRLSDHAAIAISNAELYDEVQRANLAKSDFVSLVAHELKNPMTSIKGYTELLAAGAVGPVNDMQASFLNTIRSNTERMSTLVSDLNDNSKIEAGRLRLDFKTVELNDLIDEILRSTKRQTEEKKQTVDTELPAHLPPVWADRTRLGQIFTNLVSNANKYTPEGGSIFIGAEPSANYWDPEGAGRVVHIWLRDNGIGMSPEDQQRIFQKFFRSEDPKAREVPGAGLGLNITRSLVEMQGGRIWFESEFRQGTTFHFTVPVAEG